MIEFVRQCPEVPFILDHIGKPDIRNRVFDPWKDELKTLAEMPNVYCKVSGLVTEADMERWTPEDLKPYIDHVIACFGIDRVMYGGDWPVAFQATEYPRWVETLSWATNAHSWTPKDVSCFTTTPSPSTGCSGRILIAVAARQQPRPVTQCISPLQCHDSPYMSTSFPERPRPICTVFCHAAIHVMTLASLRQKLLPDGPVLDIHVHPLNCFGSYGVSSPKSRMQSRLIADRPPIRGDPDVLVLPV